LYHKTIDIIAFFYFWVIAATFKKTDEKRKEESGKLIFLDTPEFRGGRPTILLLHGYTGSKEN